MPKKFEVLVSVLQKKTFIVEADDHKHAQTEVERLGRHAESYVICDLVDTEHIEWTVLAVKGQEPVPDVVLIPNGVEAYEKAFKAAALAQLRDSGVEVILMEEADDEGIACDNHILPWDKVIRMKGADDV